MLYFFYCFLLYCFNTVSWAERMTSGLHEIQCWYVAVIAWMEPDANDMHVFQSSVATIVTSVISCSSEKLEWFDVLLPAYPGCPGNAGHSESAVVVTAKRLDGKKLPSKTINRCSLWSYSSSQIFRDNHLCWHNTDEMLLLMHSCSC